MSQRPVCIECKKAPADAKYSSFFYCAFCWLKIFVHKNKGDTHATTQINRAKEGTMS